MVDDARHAKLRSPREPPPYFAGRAKELAALNERLDDLCETGDPSGGIALIVGVPGVGKTQLARKFADEATRREGPRRIFRMELNTRTLKAADLIVFMDMMKALGKERAGRRVADIQPKTSRVGVGALSAKVEVSREHVRRDHDLTSLMRASLDRGLWQGQALVVTIDELQAVDAVGIETLRALHVGEHGCPVLVLGVGLQHTQLVLGNPADGSSGISRVAEPIKLAPLSYEEALEAIDRNMRAMGHEIADESVVALATASQGFPQHIHGYLKAAIEAISRYGSLEAERSLEDALRAGDQARADYYDTRLSMLPDQDAMLPVIETMLETGRKSLRRSEAVAVVEPSTRVREGPAPRSKPSLDGENIVQQAIAHGVLTLNRGGVSFGIPSFHSHMEQLLNEHRQLQRWLRQRAHNAGQRL